MNFDNVVESGFGFMCAILLIAVIHSFLSDEPTPKDILKRICIEHKIREACEYK